MAETFDFVPVETPAADIAAEVTSEVTPSEGGDAQWGYTAPTVESQLLDVTGTFTNETEFATGINGEVISLSTSDTQQQEEG